ncbi:MAG: hypothetical protein HYV97_16645 [Bdellovibrio sp.]|nr:hypothetical protein [Bdellovibrio sp.]
MKRSRKTSIAKDKKKTSKIKENLRLESYRKFKSEVKKRGWILLSTSHEFVNHHRKVMVICPNGHKVALTPTHFFNRAKHKRDAKAHPRGSGCAICSGRQKDISDLQLLAKRHGGKCLNDRYHSANFKYTWQCDKGHTWKTRVSGPQYGHWCPYCSRTIIDGLKEIKELASNNGGKSLAKKYTKSQAKYPWVCGKGHYFEASHGSVLRGSWCPKCLGRYRTIEDMRDKASERGGKCLSKTYIHSFKKLEWECGKGHRWCAPPVSIFGGAWCPECGGSKKLTLEQMQELAAKRNGKCLSKKYVNARTKLQWQCQEGHRWWTPPYAIKSGAWCHVCWRIRFTIQDLKNFAKEKEGTCLSTEYESSKVKYSWACKHGHEWSATFNEARSVWCSQCSQVSRTQKVLLFCS